MDSRITPSTNRTNGSTSVPDRGNNETHVTESGGSRVNDTVSPGLRHPRSESFDPNPIRSTRRRLAGPEIQPSPERQISLEEKLLNEWVNEGSSTMVCQAREMVRDILLTDGVKFENGILKFSGSLQLAYCTDLDTLPDNLTVNGDLCLEGCTGLTALPNNLTVGGDLDLSSCTGITGLPDNLTVGGDYDLQYCTGLTTLPANLTVDGDLDLRGCTGLIALPDNLTVGGSLYLQGSTGLAALPDNLNVGGHLHLSNCTSLTSLPHNLTAGGNLYFRLCRGLTALPAYITQLGPLADGTERVIDITSTGLSEPVRQQLAQADAPGIRFIFDQAVASFQAQSSLLPDALSSWGIKPESDLHKAIVNLFAHSESQSIDRKNLGTYLARLHNTSDAHNSNAKPLLQQRITQLIQGLSDNHNDFRNTALAIISAALSTCDDRTIQALNDIDVVCQHKSEHIIKPLS